MLQGRFQGRSFSRIGFLARSFFESFPKSFHRALTTDSFLYLIKYADKINESCSHFFLKKVRYTKYFSQNFRNIGTPVQLFSVDFAKYLKTTVL